MYKGEDRVLGILSRKKRIGLRELAAAAQLNEDSVRRIVESLRSSGFAELESKEETLGVPTAELEGYAGSMFPEISVFRKALSGSMVSDLTPAEKSIGIRWARVKGLVAIESGRLVPEADGKEAEAEAARLRKAFGQLKGTGRCDDPEKEEEFFERRLLERKSSKEVTVIYTGKPLEGALETGFDVNVPGSNAPIGKSHPITKITNRMKTIMTELGFEEMEGDLVESSFWNFDALFQPQDHPARELADTFYIDGEMPLPEDRAMVERVRKAHEEGWGYRWDPKEARKAVLRTHTTALSARYLSRMKDRRPRKYFAIGRVFRNEATDYKHLAEFHQVEGIIAWEGAKFTDLLGVLKEFYRKLGFEKIRFRPSFFPYTEPSLEIEVFFEKRGQWLELGGGGIFRPEVSIPLAGTYPVLAWGLSLERPLMLLLELEDIRDFYRNDLDFLEKTHLEL
jgi:phenylalanyl-tRNA synthetase alpha chain